MAPMTLGSSSMVGGWGAAGLHNRLHSFVKRALLQQLVSPGAVVCDLFCGRGMDTANWAQAEIGTYIGVDLSASALEEAKEQWEQQGQPFPATFRELDPCMVNLETQFNDSGLPVDVVSCLAHLQDCFTSEDMVRRLLKNVVSLLKPGGYFFGITPDSSTIWYKYQKAVEEAMKVGSLRVNGTLPRVRSPLYTIVFEDDRFQYYGSKYQLRFVDGLPAQVQLLVHFPSLIRLAEEVGLEYVEIQNLTEFYEDYRVPFASTLQSSCKNLLDQKGHPMVDSKGRLSMVAIDVLSLYSTFIFKKAKCPARAALPKEPPPDAFPEPSPPLPKTSSPAREEPALDTDHKGVTPAKKKRRLLALDTGEDSPQYGPMTVAPPMTKDSPQNGADPLAGPDPGPDMCDPTLEAQEPPPEPKVDAVQSDANLDCGIGNKDEETDKIRETGHESEEKSAVQIVSEEGVREQNVKSEPAVEDREDGEGARHGGPMPVGPSGEEMAGREEVGCSHERAYGKDPVKRRRSARSARAAAGQSCSVNYQSEVEQEPAFEREPAASVSARPPPLLFYQRKRRTQPGAGAAAHPEVEAGSARLLRPRRLGAVGGPKPAPAVAAAAANPGDEGVAESSNVKQEYDDTGGVRGDGPSGGRPGRVRARVGGRPPVRQGGAATAAGSGRRLTRCRSVLGLGGHERRPLLRGAPSAEPPDAVATSHVTRTRSARSVSVTKDPKLWAHRAGRKPGGDAAESVESLPT